MPLSDTAVPEPAALQVTRSVLTSTVPPVPTAT